MRKNLTYPILGLIVFLLCWINLPPLVSDRLREWIAAPFGKRAFDNRSDEIARLQLEGSQLRTQIDQVYEWLLSNQKIVEEFKDVPFLEKRAAHLKERLLEQFISIPAQVIYRNPALWSSSLWVNVGEKTNAALGKKAIAKNSPVIADGNLVGVIEFVGRNHSRVRLITDSGLSPSVRVCRGKMQNRELVHQIDSLSKWIEKRDDLFADGEKEALFSHLEKLKANCQANWEDGYLAKGELKGSSSPFWRSRSPMLKGIGFNYDYLDSFSEKSPKIPILKEGDLLVTSGLDGVFPPGLPVGIVAEVDPQPVGAYCYEIDVKPTASRLNDLQTLFIIPPMEE